MRRVEVKVTFTIDVLGDEDGIPSELERVSWIDAITFGLNETDWKVIDSVHCNATRRLTYLGDPTTPNGMKRRSRLGPRKSTPTKGQAR